MSWLATRATLGLDLMNWSDAAKIRSGAGCSFCGIEWVGLRALNRYNNERYSLDAGANHSGWRRLDVGRWRTRSGVLERDWRVGWRACCRTARGACTAEDVEEQGRLWSGADSCASADSFRREVHAGDYHTANKFHAMCMAIGT